jgi:hypothetical protein
MRSRLLAFRRIKSLLIGFVKRLKAALRLSRVGSSQARQPVVAVRGAALFFFVLFLVRVDGGSFHYSAKCLFFRSWSMSVERLIFRNSFEERFNRAKPLMLTRQPNLEQTCRDRLPDWVMSELKNQASPSA